MKNQSFPEDEKEYPTQRKPCIPKNPLIATGYDDSVCVDVVYGVFRDLDEATAIAVYVRPANVPTPEDDVDIDVKKYIFNDMDVDSLNGKVGESLHGLVPLKEMESPNNILARYYDENEFQTIQERIEKLWEELNL